MRRGLEGGDQRAVAGDARPVRSPSPLPLPRARGGVAEQLVLDAEEGAAAGGEVAAAGQAHRLAAGGPVEGLGDGRPPVDDDRLPVLVGDRDPPDVEGVGRRRRVASPGRSRRWRSARGVVEVDAAEHEGGVAEVELPEPVRPRCPR